MRVIVACEYSGRVRDAFRRRGHDAWSCDLFECEADPRWHLQQWGTRELPAIMRQLALL